MKNQTKRILVIILGCFLLRLGFFLIVQPWVPEIEESIVIPSGEARTDSLEYHISAILLLEQHRFATEEIVPHEALRTPGYPVFIALIYALFGYHPWVVLLFQILLDTFACFLLIKALTLIFNPQLAYIAGIIYAFDPYVIMYDSFLFSDSLFVFLLIFGFLIFGCIIQAERVGTRYAFLVLFLGLIMGISAMVKPISLYLPVVFFAYSIMASRSHIINALKSSLIILAGFSVIIVPWIFRNYVTFGEPAFSTSGDFNLLALTVTPMEMVKQDMDDADVVRSALFLEADDMMRRDNFQPEQLNEFQKAKYWRQLALHYMYNDPIGTVTTIGRGILDLFINLETSAFSKMLHLQMNKFDIKSYSNIGDLIRDFISKKGIMGIVMGGVVGIYLLFTYFSTVVGLLLSWRSFHYRYLIYCLLTGGYFIVLTGAAGLARFRLPAIPFFLIFTAIGIDFLFSRLVFPWKKKPI